MDFQSPPSNPPRGEQTMAASSRGSGRVGRGRGVPQPSPFSQRPDDDDDDGSCSNQSLTIKKQMSSVAQKLSTSIGSLGARRRLSEKREEQLEDSDPEIEDDEQKSQEVEGAEKHAEAGTALRSHLLQRAMQKDLDPLNIVVVDQNQPHNVPPHKGEMTRFELLSLCRDSVPSPHVGAERAREDGRMMASSLQLRDLRILQGVRGPAIFVRRGAMVVSLDPMHAVITRDKAYVVVPEEDPQELVKFLLTRVQQAAAFDSQHGGLPFELVALEALMVTSVKYKRKQVVVFSKLSDVGQVDACAAAVKRILRSIRKNMSVSLLNKILTEKKDIDELYQNVRGAQEAIEEIQDDDDAMIHMFLSATHRDPSLIEKMQELNATQTNRLHLMEVEVLLDAYALEYEGLANALSGLHKDIDATEDLLKFKLDKARNRLIRIDVAFGMIGAWLGACTAVAGYFGMNVPYGAYTDGTVKPGEDFEPPTSGTHYSGPWSGGPSWEFFEVGVSSIGGTVVLIVLTCLSYCLFGAVRVWAVRRRLKRKESELSALVSAERPRG